MIPVLFYFFQPQLLIGFSLLFYVRFINLFMNQHVHQPILEKFILIGDKLADCVKEHTLTSEKRQNWLKKFTLQSLDFKH